MNSARRKSWLLRIGGLLAVGVLFVIVPPVHVVSLKASQKQTSGETFDPSAFVEQLWTGKLVEVTRSATDARTLIADIRESAKTAREKHARTGGLGSAYYYFVRGEGRVLSADAHAVAVAVNPTGTEADIVLDLDNVFGNAARDGTGIVNVSDFANSQQFNAIASELNQRIEARVLPTLRDVRAGSTLRFAGCAEINDEDHDLRPLHLIPLPAAVQ